MKVVISVRHQNRGFEIHPAVPVNTGRSDLLSQSQLDLSILVDLTYWVSHSWTFNTGRSDRSTESVTAVLPVPILVDLTYWVSHSCTC